MPARQLVLPAALDEIRAQVKGFYDRDPDKAVRWIRKLLPHERAVVSRALGRHQLEPHQIPPPGDWDVWLLLAGRGCLAAGSLVWDPIHERDVRIEDRTEPGWVLGLGAEGPVPVFATPSYRKGRTPLFRVRTATGDAVLATAEHRFLTPWGWRHLREIGVGSVLASGDRRSWPGGGPRSSDTGQGSPAGCRPPRSSGDPRPPWAGGTGPDWPPSLGDAPAHTPTGSGTDAPRPSPAGTPPCPPNDPHSRSGSWSASPSPATGESRGAPSAPWLPPPSNPAPGRSPACSTPASPGPVAPTRLWTTPGPRLDGTGASPFSPCPEPRPLPAPACAGPSGTTCHSAPPGPAGSNPPRRGASLPPGQFDLSPSLHNIRWTEVVAIDPAGIADYYDLHVPGPNSYLANGLWHHNSGKTEACADWFDKHMQGPPCDPRIPGGHRAAIVAPTLSDAWDACVAGPSGLQMLNPKVTAFSTRGTTVVRWPNGAKARLFGTHTQENVDRLRAGGNVCAAWCEELAAWPRLDEGWEHLDLGLRLGPHPQRVASTTPKTRLLIKELKAQGERGSRTVALTRATTHDNPHLHEKVRSRLFEKYEGTRTGRQELYAELLEDVEGALLTLEQVEAQRWRGEWVELESGLLAPAIPRLKRLGIGVDPPGGRTECGIVAAGLGEDGDAYVLEDYSLLAGADTWPGTVVSAYHEREADAVIGESNYGGDMVKKVIQGEDSSVHVQLVHASRGKTVRAEPVVNLTARHHVWFVGSFPRLEDQLTTWVDEKGAPSPNRLDAWVWILWWLKVGHPRRKGTTHGRQIAAARIEP